MITSLGVRLKINGVVHVWPVHNWRDYKLIAQDMQAPVANDTILYGYIDTLEDNTIEWVSPLDAKSRARKYGQKFTTKENPYKADLHPQDLEFPIQDLL